MKMTVVAMEMAEMAVVECFMLGEGKGVWCYEGGSGQFFAVEDAILVP